MPRLNPLLAPSVLERHRLPSPGRVARPPPMLEGLPDPERVVRSWRRAVVRRLRTRLKASVSLDLHDNTHTMLTFKKVGPKWRLRLHHMFLDAPAPVLDALAIYVNRADPGASAVLDRFIDERKDLIRKVTLAEQRRRLRLEPAGHHHHLGRIFDRLNARYFKGAVAARITYGPAPRLRRPRKSIKMGSYSSESKVIRIHPALDQPSVPRYFVEWIVFHEMLHHVHRARRLEDGRRCVHTPQFQAHERRFHGYDRALRWERENLELLLNARV